MNPSEEGMRRLLLVWASLYTYANACGREGGREKGREGGRRQMRFEAACSRTSETDGCFLDTPFPFSFFFFFFLTFSFSTLYLFSLILFSPLPASSQLSSHPSYPIARLAPSPPLLVSPPPSPPRSSLFSLPSPLHPPPSPSHSRDQRASK